ncbi:hypothetical protein HDU98_006595 [Podochytrium sp. JEL0797]|nr:hypothetical protein HDU98_006595 [Podochytrium sp. JEL0797]
MSTLNPFSPQAAIELSAAPLGGNNDDLISSDSVGLTAASVSSRLRVSGQAALRIGSRALVATRPLGNPAKPGDAAAKAHAQWSRDTARDNALAPAASVLDISASAWWHLKRGGEDQAIVLLGETATGKSESRRLLTRHLCDISTLKPGHLHDKRKKSKLVSAILKLDAIMTAFSHASTPSNPNASTGGRYYEYQFNKKAKIVGVKVIDFLMDRTRVTGASDGGCNFNVFYMLVEGATKEEKVQWQLGDSAHYHYLNLASIRYVPSTTVDLDTLRESLKSVGIGKRHQTQVFQLLAAILHLGNIAFVNDDGDKSEEPCRVKNQQQLSLVADLLGVHPTTLETCLTYKTQVIRKDKISVFLDAKGATEQRDSLARALYSVVLSYLVEQINNALCVTDESQWSHFIAVTDLPGSFYGGNQVGGDSGYAFQRLLVNYGNVKVENFMMEQVFVVPADVLRAEGLMPPLGALSGKSGASSAAGVKKAMVDALDGDIGLLRMIDVECAVGTKGSRLMDKLREADVSAGDRAGHRKFVGLGGSFDKKTKHFFTVTHYVDTVSDEAVMYGGAAGRGEPKELLSTQYDARGFVEANLDVLQSDFVALVRGNTDQPGTSSVFLRGLFSDRMVATLTHAGDKGTVVAAVERGRFPSLKRAGGASAKRELTGVDMTIGQKVCLSVHRHAQKLNLNLQFRTTLDGIFETLTDTQSWFILHLKQTDDPSNSKFDAATFTRQIENLAIVPLCQNTAMLYSAAFKHDDFVARFARVLGDGVVSGDAKTACERVVAVNGWESGQAKMGKTKVFLSEGVWRRLEDGLCGLEEAEKAADKYAAASEYGAETEYMESHAGDEVESHYESEFGGGAGISLREMKGKGEVDAAEEGRLLQNEMLVKANKGGKSELVSKKKMSGQRKLWVCITWGLTWWVPSFALSCCGGMKLADRRMAWREKVALCVIIALMNGAILFLIIGMGLILCPLKDELSPGQISAKNSLDHNPLVFMYGTYYAAYATYKSHLQLGAGTQGFWEAAVFGQDVAQMFDKSQYWSSYCPSYPNKPAALLYFPQQNPNLASGKWYPHGLYAPFTDHLPLMDQYKKGTVVWDSGSIGNLISASKRIITMDNNVYDVSAFYSDAYKGKNFFNQSAYIQAMFDKYSPSGGDASFEWDYLKQMDPATWEGINSCMNGLFYVGRVDHRNDIKCQVSNYILLAASAVLVLVIGIKFLAALQFGGKPAPEDHDKFVICLVPCYTEGESSLQKTIESLASMEYEDKHKLLFIVADGMIIGSGNDRPTPRIVLDILGVDPALDPTSCSFESVGEGGKQHNVGKVYSGLYEINGRVVPYIVVVKVGRPSERQRPGNRGKRDSQLVLMRYLNRVHFNLPMNPLELEMYHHMKNIIGVDPSFYEYIFSVDADTEPYKDALNRLVAHMVRDAKVIASCGETKLSNEKESWVSMMQVYEYYISHNMAKAFESLFGSVTCLPGCFTIYRIRTPVKNIPLLIAPGLVTDYSENTVDTLHMKNLLFLGEDRYLTTLLMKHFPHMRTTFIPDAKCMTVGPAKFAVLLSQRRRWINSTVHNLMELLMLKQLCGMCCFDMRFVVFIDLFATFVQPATLIYIAYLIYAATAHPDQFSFPLISIIMIAAIYGFQVIIFLVKREWQHIGWMIVYLLCIPYSALYIPLYSFWHFDDFSWGNTRVVIEDGHAKEVGVEEEPFNPAEIVLQKWTDYESDRLKRGDVSPPATSQHSGSVAGGYPVPAYGQQQFTAPMYMGSAYGAAPASVYGNGSNYGALVQQQQQQYPGSVYAGSAYGQPVQMGPGAPGSIYGSAYGQPQPQMMGYAGTSFSSGPQQPTDEQILVQVRQILATADLMSVTRKSVREELGRVFGVDLGARKEYVHACIDGVLKGELKAVNSIAIDSLEGGTTHDFEGFGTRLAFSTPLATGEKITSEMTETKTIVNSLLDKFVALRLAEDPFTCATFGVRKHEDEVFDLSLQGALKSRDELLALQAETQAFADVHGAHLSADEAADVAFLLQTIETGLVSAGIPGESGYAFELAHTHMSSPFAYLEMMFQNYQRTEDAQDMQNYKTRLELLGQQFDFMIDSFKSGIRRKITLNKEGVELLILKFAAGAGPVDASVEEATAFAVKSPLNNAAKSKELMGDENYLVPAIRDVIMPGYARAKKFLEEEYIQHARINPGLYGLPNFEQEYSNLIFQNTNVRYTANEIHALGLKEVARIELLMESAKTACGFDGTVSQFQAAINVKEKYPQLYYDNNDAVLEDYNKICAAAKAKMVDYFEVFPKFDCTVIAVPEFLEAQLPLALYMPGTPQKSGNFVANMRLHKIKPSHQKTALCLHEANPGHHHQISLSFENENLHLARRLVVQTSYAEGWGLYCEFLGEEMGFYSDPYQYFGRLELEMFRAIRLVVDSGLHAKGWSIEQAADYMLSKVSMSREEIVTEVRRYCVIPGQALSYKVGEFKIKELRRFAEKELGDKFSIKKFHACVIDFGSLPLGTLEVVVKKWVADSKA